MDTRASFEGAATPDERATAPPTEPPVRRRSVVFDRLIPAVTLLVVVGLLALLAYSLFRPAPAGGRPAGVAINENGAMVTLRPKPASDFTLPLFTGGEVRLSDLRGKVVVVNFWASWCPPCRREAPALETAWQALQDENVVFIGVDVWDKQKDALAFIDEFGVSYLNGPDKSSIAIDYGLTGVPETYVIDPRGNEVAKFIGPITVGDLTSTVRAIPR